MIIPTFSLSQTDETMSIVLHIPLGDLGNSEFLVEDGIVYFSASPYYLKLVLPGPVLETDDKIDFDMNGCDLVVTLRKLNPGEYFEDLDLLSKFLVTQKSAKTDKFPKIEMLEPMQALEGDVIYDWFQPLSYISCDSSIFISSSGFGFANARRDLFSDKSDVNLPIDVQNPDNCPISRRRTLRLQAITEKFNSEHYLADFCETEASSMALSQSAPWLKNQPTSRPEFTAENCHRLILLADRRLPLLPPISTETNSLEDQGLDRRSLYLGLLDLLLSYTHDLYIRESEENSESAWVIVKIATSLSWLEVFQNLQDLLQSFYQSALTFPLVRNWKLCCKVQLDVATMLSHKEAKSWCLFILLEIRRFLIDYSGYYIFVELFLDDYIVWLQKFASPNILNDLGEKLAHTKVKKSDVGLPLKQLEKLSADILEQERLCAGLHSVSIAS